MDAIIARQWRQAGDQQPQAAPQRDYLSLKDMLALLKQHLATIAAFLALGLLGAWFYIATTDPIYTATTQILIEPKLSQLAQQQVNEVNLSLDTAQIESQIAVMQSEKIASMVIQQLKLRDDKRFNQSNSPTLAERLARLRASAAAALGLEGGTWFQSVRGFFGASEAGTEPVHQPLKEFEQGRRTMRIFNDGLDVRRVGVSYAIDMSFSSNDPDLAAKVANSAAEAFVREQVETKAAAAREGGAWLERRLRELRTQMNNATQVAQEFRSRHDYRVARPAEEVAGEAKPKRADGPTLEELEVTADTYRKIYESFLQAYTSSVSQQSYPVADARVITLATRPLLASHPRPKLVIAFGVLAGIVAGVGFAFLRHTLDRTVRSPHQIREDLGLECIGELPVVGGRRGGFARLDEVVRSPQSRFSDSMRSVKTAISLADTAHPIRCIGVTSALPGEGKSLCASNLAMLYVRYGLRTLVIDADTYHSALSEGFGAGPDAERKSDRSNSIKKHIKFVTTFGFDLLPSAVVNSRGLLSAKNMEALLPELGDYDMIVVDLPPLTSGADRLSIGSLLDGVIMVVEWGKTPAGLVAELARALQAGKGSIIGVLLTKVRIMSTPRYRRVGTLLPR